MKPEAVSGVKTPETNFFASVAERLLSLRDGTCLTDLSSGLGVYHLGASTSHPLKEAGIINSPFYLIFQLDPEVTKLSSDVTFQTELLQASSRDANEEYVLVKTMGHVDHEPPCFLKSKFTNKQRVIGSRLLPVSGMERARDLLSQYTAAIQSSWKSGNLPPVIIAVNASSSEDNKNRTYIGQGFSLAGPKTYYQTFTCDSLECLRDIEVELSLSSMLSKGDAEICNYACYDLNDKGGDLLEESSSSANLHLCWKSENVSPSRFLGKPLSTQVSLAFLTVKGSSKMDRSSSEVFTADESLDRILSSMLSILDHQAEDFEPYMNNSTELKDWVEKVQGFIQSTALLPSKGCDSQTSSIETDLIEEKENLRNQNRLTQPAEEDFTETFWLNIVEPSGSSIPKILEALKLVSKAMREGTLVPFVSKTNDTFLGKFCHQAGLISGKKNYGAIQKDSSSNNISKWNQIANMLETGSAVKSGLLATKIFEVGMWKAEKDVQCLLDRLGIFDSEVKSNLEFFFGKDQGTSLAEQLSRLVCVRDFVQVLSMSKQCQCPVPEMVTLAKQSLDYFLKTYPTRRTIVVKPQKEERKSFQFNRERPFPRFVLPIHSTLPWVDSVNSARSPLPTPNCWMLYINTNDTNQCYYCTPQKGDSLSFGLHMKAKSVSEIITEGGNQNTSEIQVSHQKFQKALEKLEFWSEDHAEKKENVLDEMKEAEIPCFDSSVANYKVFLLRKRTVLC